MIDKMEYNKSGLVDRHYIIAERREGARTSFNLMKCKQCRKKNLLLLDASKEFDSCRSLYNIGSNLMNGLSFC